MEDLNLHFTGDFHAITSANNLLAAMLDNHIQQGNALGIDPRNIVWKRCVDMNDRVLRNIVVGLGNKMDGMVREDHFVITVASEIMAILCLADDLADLKRRLGRIIVAYTFEGNPVTADDLQATGAMTALLKDAIKPNMIQTLEHTPALVHGGPFANIAHGCNSVRATKLALKISDITITEAGFGADLGAEKFMDIKCRKAGLKPDAVVLVATVRALKYNGGVAKQDLGEENLEALTLSCFKLIEQIDTTGCVALSLLNDDGIIAGCEGDLQSVFTLLAVKALTGKDGFMANPSMINSRTNELILAHCTVGLKQTERYIIRNHFETEKGIAIQGLLPTGDVTIIKCGGECLDEYYLSTGTLTENTNYINMCRTQVRIHMNTPAEYFLKNPLGNHHIMLHGNYEDTLNEFFQANACKRTE